MKKVHKYLTGAIFIILVALSLFLWKAAEMTTRTYIGINGETVTLRGHFSSDFNTKNSEPEMHKIGDVIINENGEEEVVYAVDEDGSFMTISVEDYEQMMNSIESD